MLIWQAESMPSRNEIPVLPRIYGELTMAVSSIKSTDRPQVAHEPGWRIP